MSLKNAPYVIALICVFLPASSVHITATLAMSFENIQTCLPYWSECYSISATGRGYPEFFVFKALLIPTAVFMVAYWILLHQWIKEISNGEYSPRPVTIMGLIASLALVIYTVTLGAKGDPYVLARNVGIIFYFAFNVFGHLVLLSYLDKIDTEKLFIVRSQNRLIITTLIMLGTAIATAFIGLHFDEFWDRWQNAYEWWFSLLMVTMFYHVADMWKTTNFHLHHSSATID